MKMNALLIVKILKIQDLNKRMVFRFGSGEHVVMKLNLGYGAFFTVIGMVIFVGIYFCKVREVEHKEDEVMLVHEHIN